LDNFLANHNDFDDETRQSLEECNVLIDSNIPLERTNVDNNCINYGNKLIDLCRNNNLFIVNGRIGESRLTCKDSCTIDYVICSAVLFQSVKNFFVHDFCNLYSDVHCAISFNVISQQTSIETKQPNQVSKKVKSKSFYWDSAKATDLENNIDSNKFNNVLNSVDELKTKRSINKHEIDKRNSDICKICLD
jgi:hypothetical protein